ncbi:MAG TPA: aminopeptidase N [Gammaproteobacteria bacterium]|nr:aminopeptidase N [Gammaproteobacteria bacterium]
MSDAAPKTVYLKDYAPPPYLVDKVDLRFELGEDFTRVGSRLEMRRNPDADGDRKHVVLDGVGLAVDSARLDGEVLHPDRYVVGDESLLVHGVPERFTLELETRLKPQENTALEGLYKSHAIFCTQCEAEGFRKITWFPDRPDVMSRYTTTIVADERRYPVLLSNGNPVDRGRLDDGRHWVRWEDPFPKPSYLFALVAGALACIDDSFTTRSGRTVALQIYVEHHNADKCNHAMAALKKAMRWDEEAFGREYDLDIYMIVAVDDFNMGAMENKGLNIFNSKYVLARPDTATDADFADIEGVIAHEYFHNWTGNRVTCRDWFQLSLKEGLTVFRDQQFSADTFSRPVKRIQDVRTLRSYQFAEDAGPMAHPVRPDSYIEISNFYTVTVYDKGAEVIRMIHTLLGEEGFRDGMDLYFERHDGQAVTTDHFVSAMEDANGVDLSQFRLWYSQAGTPEISVEADYDTKTGSCTLSLSQHCPPTPGQADKRPMHIPLQIALLDADGKNLEFRLEGDNEMVTERVLELKEVEKQFRLREVGKRPVLSIGRGFSAPVKLRLDRSESDLEFLMARESDDFNRWDAAQELITSHVFRLMNDRGVDEAITLPGSFVEAFAAALRNHTLDKALIAEALTLPSESYLADRMDVIDVDAIHAARRGMQRALAAELEPLLMETYTANSSNEPYRFDPESAGRRRLKNLCLAYLVSLETETVRALGLTQFEQADNMTDVLAALSALANCDCPERGAALAAFERKWRNEALVMDKWFSLQATSRLPGTLDRVRELMGHDKFDPRNPNRIRSLIGAFCHANPVRFHAADGTGYRFLADQVIDIDRRNPQIAARLLGSLSRWRKFDPKRRALMKSSLERILSTEKLSRDTYEIASKTLA